MKTVAQSFFMLTIVQFSALRTLERLLRSRDVVELALGVVVQDEESQGGASLAAREAEHGHVSVRVSRAKDRAAADPAPDAHRLRRPVVEDVGLGEIDERTAVLVVGVLQAVRAADHALGWDPVDLVRDHSHEVAAAT